MYKTYKDYEFGKEENKIKPSPKQTECKVEKPENFIKVETFDDDSTENVVKIVPAFGPRASEKPLPEIKSAPIEKSGMIIRALWGESGSKFNQNCISQMKTLCELKNQGQLKNSIVYVFGDENCEIAKSNGFKTVLVSSNPMPYPDNARIQIEVLKQAFAHYPDKNILYVGWGLCLKNNIDQAFWESLNDSKKADIQAPLRMYKKRYCKWRKEDQRKVPDSNIVYIRDKNIPDQLIDVWQRENPSILDRILMKYLDESLGEWKGSDFYKDHFELNGFASKWTKEMFPNINKDEFFEEISIIKKANDKIKAKTGDYQKPQLAPEFAEMAKQISLKEAQDIAINTAVNIDKAYDKEEEPEEEPEEEVKERDMVTYRVSRGNNSPEGPEKPTEIHKDIADEDYYLATQPKVIPVSPSEFTSTLGKNK